MKQLYSELKSLINDLDLFKKLISANCVPPFSKEGRVFSYLLSKDIISFADYERISGDYARRNKYLQLFEMAPRPFGETWGEKHILEKFPEFKKATKKSLAKVYPNFDGEFDLWLDGIRVEVKACRANSDSTGKGESLARRAYFHKEAKDNNFKYHYQQLKPSCCDVFIWIGVCRDELIYWVLPSNELNNRLISQHRNENTGKETVKVFEGQVFMTEEELSEFRVEEQNVLNIVKQKGANKVSR